jgi:PAS domain S-box-containing protein
MPRDAVWRFSFAGSRIGQGAFLYDGFARAQELKVVRQAFGDAIVDSSDSPCIRSLHAVWSARDGTEAPSADDFARVLHPGYVDFTLVLRRVPLTGDINDYAYEHYGLGIRRMSGLDLVGTRVSAFPGPLSTLFLGLYRDIDRRQEPGFSVHVGQHSPLVLSWQRAMFPCRLADGAPGIFVWMVPLEYRLEVVSGFLNGTEDGLGAWHPIRDGHGRIVDFVCLYANDALCRMAGTAPGLMTGRRILDDMHPTWGPASFGAMCAVSFRPPGDPVVFDYAVPSPEGDHHYRSSITANGGNIVVVVSDLTPLYQRERMVETAQRQVFLLREAVDATDVGITVADPRIPGCPLVFVNEAFLRTSGYAREEVLGRNCRFLQGADTEPDVLVDLRACIAEGRTFRGTLTNFRKDGTRFLNRLHIAPVRSSDGDLVAFIGVQHDVTRDEEAREAVAQRERMEALGRLAGGIAHEINNLLQPALLLPDVIAADLPADAVDARSDLATIADAARAARQILRSFLAYTRGDAAVSERIDSAGAVSGALDLVEALQPAGALVRRRGALTDHTSLGHIVASPSQIMQVLTNLVANGVQAMGGRGVIDVGLERETLADGPHARLWVEDTGCGMEEAVRRRIFEPFFTTKGVGEGTGLGLSVVYGIVGAWNGRITVQSAPGAGTCISIHVPIAD